MLNTLNRGGWFVLGLTSLGWLVFDQAGTPHFARTLLLMGWIGLVLFTHLVTICLVFFISLCDSLPEMPGMIHRRIRARAGFEADGKPHRLRDLDDIVYIFGHEWQTAVSQFQEFSFVNWFLVRAS